MNVKDYLMSLKAWSGDFCFHSLNPPYKAEEAELAVTVDEGEEAGNWVPNWAYLTIKYKDGRRPINLWVNAVYKIEDGSIVDSRTFYDEADALRQLGYSIEPVARK